MKNKIMLGLVLLLAFSAFLVGCSSGSKSYDYTAPPSGPAPSGGGCGVAEGPTAGITENWAKTQNAA